jgi:hypothetical protein
MQMSLRVAPLPVEKGRVEANKHPCAVLVRRKEKESAEAVTAVKFPPTMQKVPPLPAPMDGRRMGWDGMGLADADCARFCPVRASDLPAVN